MIVFAATGHRPNKLGGYDSATDDALRALATWFLSTNRPDSVISGMALGWDMAWAEAAIALGIPVTAAVPFHGQESAWPIASQYRYAKILAACNRIETVCEGGYAPWKMQVRNKWMVDHATNLIALWDGSKGGTSNCINYASGLVPICNLWDYWIDRSFVPVC